MPGLSVWMLRWSLCSLLIGGGLGAWRLTVGPSGSGTLRAVHADLMLFGWLVPFVLGVAYWMLPRFATRPDRGSPGLAACGAGLLGIGMLLSVAAHLAGWPPGEAALGRVVILAGIGVFGGQLWRRVKPFGAP